MNISDKGIELIKSHEGCVLRAYKCPAGRLTIGYGHTFDVRPGQTISQSQALDLLRRDLKIVQTCINAAVPATLTQCQFDALCSFVFNVGCGAFLRSSLLKKIKVNPSDAAIREEFCKWVRGGGEVLPGLVRRRAAEADLYFSL